MSCDYSMEQIREIAAEVATKFGVEKVALFGSYARGEQTEGSDFDFLIEKGDLKGYFQLADFVIQLEKRLGKTVDVITYNSLPDSFLADALLDEVVIYERTRCKDSFKNHSLGNRNGGRYCIKELL